MSNIEGDDKMYHGAEVYVDPYDGYKGKKLTNKGKRILEEFHNKYKKYKRRSTQHMEAYDINKNENLEELFHFVIKNQEFLDFQVIVYEIYEKKDYENADAFYPWFNFGGEYYDESEKNNSLIDVSTKGGGGIALKEPVRVRFTAKQKEKLKKEYIGYTVERFEDCFISVKLRDFLIENGISKKYFKETYDTKGDIIAYRLWGQDNILPSQAVKIDNFEIYSDTDEHIYYWEYIYYDEAPIDKYLKKHHSMIVGSDLGGMDTISKDIIQYLQDINETFEYRYFLGMRKTIVNRKFYELVKEVIPNADKYFIPLKTV